MNLYRVNEQLVDISPAYFRDLGNEQDIERILTQLAECRRLKSPEPRVLHRGESVSLRYWLNCSQINTAKIRADVLAILDQVIGAMVCRGDLPESRIFSPQGMNARHALRRYLRFV